LTLLAADLLQGAYDSDGDVLSIFSIYAAKYGLVTLTSAGDIRFTINPDFVGTTSFKYTVSDGKGGMAVATATFTVDPTSTFNGSAGADVYLGLDSADTVYGNDGDDTLDGGYGDDTLYGGSGNDVLVGGVGADQLIGGAGLDTVSYAAAKTGVAMDLATGVGMGGEASGDFYVDVENVFGSGYSDVLSGDASSNLVDGADGDDLLDGAGGADSLVGGVGNDTLAGGSGADTLEGGYGNDLLMGQADNDLILGGHGNDTLRGGAGTDTLNGGGGIDIVSYSDAASAVIIDMGAGTKSGNTDAIGDVFLSIEGVEGSNFNDRLIGNDAANLLLGNAGNDSLYGGSGNDTLIGGIGNYYLAGGNGTDRYLFNLGDGQDIVFDLGNEANDVLEFGEGIAASHVIVAQADSGSDLWLTIGADRVTFDGAISEAYYRVEQVRFADGTTWSWAQIFDMSVSATSGDDVFYGDERANTLRGDAGKDSLYGRAGNDTLAGGSGNDYLSGGSGSDTYLFNLGDGQDVIREYGSETTDVLRFGVGIDVAQVTVTQGDSGNDLVLILGTDRVTLDQSIYDSFYRVDQISFADGTNWSYTQMFDLSLAGTSANDVLYGDARSNTIGGGNGADRLAGRDGADRLIGGQGNDTLVGGLHSDTFVFDSGFGSDIITDFKAGAGTDDVIEFSSIVFADFEAVLAASSQAGSNVLISAGSSDVITLQNVTLSSLHVDDFRFV